MLENKGKEKKSSEVTGKDFVICSSILLDSPLAPLILIKGGNKVTIPWATYNKLVGLKKDRDKREEAEQALVVLDELSEQRNENFNFMTPDWSKIKDIKHSSELSRTNANDHIIATALTLSKKDDGGKNVFFLTHSNSMKTKAREMRRESGEACYKIQEWERDKGRCVDEFQILEIDVPSKLLWGIKKKTWLSTKLIPMASTISENAGALLCPVYPSGKKGQKVLVGRKGKNLEIIPHDISILGQVQRPIKKGGREFKNYAQMLSIWQLKDKMVPYKLLVGPAGTGKTYLAIVAAIEMALQKDSKIEKIFITRAIVAEGNDLGYLPGGLDDKMSGWVGGMMDNIGNLKRNRSDLINSIDILLEGPPKPKKEEKGPEGGDGNKGPKKGGNNKKGGNKKGEKKRGGGNEKKKFPTPKNGDETAPAPRLEVNGLPVKNVKKQVIFILDPSQLRGRDLSHAVIIYDEMQNLSPQQGLTVVTRLGNASFMFITGDPDQVDSNYLTAKRNALMWFAKLMKVDKYESCTVLYHPVRHPAVAAVVNNIKNMSVQM